MKAELTNVQYLKLNCLGRVLSGGEYGKMAQHNLNYMVKKEKSEERKKREKRKRKERGEGREKRKRKGMKRER